MTESQPTTALISQARQRLTEELRGQAEQLQQLEQGLQSLRSRHQQLEAEIHRQLERLAKGGSSDSGPAQGAAVPLDRVLASVRNLITATLPEQVFTTLAEEAEQMGVRAAIFDVRGKAAWGASARGFGPELSDKTFRALVVPLNKDNPFRQAYETGGHVDVTVDALKKSRNIFDKFNPSANVQVLLLPIRSAGSVSAIFYSDTGRKSGELPVDALKILSEFAGAQLDRLMALSGGLSAVAAEGGVEAVEVEEPVARAPIATATRPVTEAPPQPASSPTPPAGSVDISQLSEADEKVHKDARRFAKLLISEIELYNKAKVADGRKHCDLYRRLKVDIDRSRHTYEKRFGKTLAKQFDYFHDELVKTLTGNEPSLLGSDYPGPSV